ncbi:MAG: hypothetical protein AB1894_29675 [Chloroflexota bacterium]
MKKICFALVLIWTVLALAACQSQMKPEEVVLAAVEPAKTADLEKALSYYTDDIVYTMVGFAPEPQVFRGKMELGDWLKQQYADQMVVQLHVDKVDGNQVYATTQFTSNFFRGLGIDWMTCKEEYTVVKGEIQAWSCTVTQESLEKFMAAMTPKVGIADIAGKWKWTGEPPAYFIYNQDGTYTMIRDVNGTQINWDVGGFTLADNTLTLTSSQESKYCSSGSKGIYSLRLTEEGRLELNMVEDDCWRRRPPEEGPQLFEHSS